MLPWLLYPRTAATLTSASVTSLADGSGNLLISVVTDATHATVAIPASDLASKGVGTIAAVNVGATPSTGLAITIN